MKTQTIDTRQHILDTGYKLIVEKGFTSVGLSQLLNNAEVPKGSFYHYFKSKEQFGEALIEDYFSSYFERLEMLFGRDDNTAYENLMGYWEMWVNSSQGACGSQKCLVVKLSAEVSDLSEPMRIALMQGANKIIASIANCIDMGKADGSISVESSHDTATFLYNYWLGSALMHKLTKEPSSLKQAFKTSKQALSGQINL